MSERHTSAVAPAPRPPHTTARPPTAPPLGWDRYFPALAPDDQTALLELARDPHGLPLRDLPPLPPHVGPHDRPERFLARLFAPLAAPLPPFDAVGGEFPGVVATAVGCPDLFLIACPAGSNRTELIADVAAASGCAVTGRTLILVRSPASADALVAKLAERYPTEPFAIVGRAAAPGESPSDTEVEAVRRRIAADLEAAEFRLAALDAVPELASAARELAVRLAEIPQHADRVLAERSAIAARVAAEAEGSVASAFADGVRELASRHATALAEIDAKARQANQDLLAKQREMAALREQIAALAVPKPGTGVVGFLKGWFAKDDGPSRLPELEAKLAATEAACRELDAVLAGFAAPRAECDASFAAERESLIRNEVACREAEADSELADLAAERDRAHVDLAGFATQIAALGPTLSDEPTTADLDRVVAETASFRERTAADAGFAREWLAQLTANAADLAERFLSQIRIVVAPTTAIGHDPLLSRCEEFGPPFDRLIVADAETIPESEFLAAARLASRWILVGDPSAPPPRVSGRGPRPAPPPFPRLWHRLHRPAWVVENGGLVARLADVPRSALRPEPLADRPDIEVRFAESPTGDLTLAEVRFPAGWTVASAKQFLAAELGEIRLAPLGRLRWHESPDEIRACWPSVDGRSAVEVDLGQGIRETLAGTGSHARTAAVAFSRAEGWTQESAAAWLVDKVAAARSSRTAFGANG